MTNQSHVNLREEAARSPDEVTRSVARVRQTFAMDDRVDFFCARPDHQGAEPNDALTMHQERWAYCPAAKSEPHDWQATGGMSLEDVKRFALRHPIRRRDA